MNQFVAPVFRDFSPRVQIRAIADDTPNGSGSGCGSVTGYLDSWGTMTLPGSFEESVSFLNESGFLCDGHGRATNGYTEESDIGLFTKVSEDEEGLQLDWAYHPKQKSQDARTTLQHRLDNKKKSGLSIGFFVGDGRSQPTGWTYDPDEDMPEGVDYICVNAQYFEEVLIKVSKPEFLKDNLDRAKGQYSIYLFLRVHVFEVSQTLVPANEVSLIAEVRSVNSKTKTKMATNTRAKDDEDSHADAVQGLKRTARALKNEHKEFARACSEHLDTLAKHLAKFDSKEEDDEDDKDPEEEKPEKKKPDEEKKDRGRKLFEKGGKA